MFGKHDNLNDPNLVVKDCLACRITGTGAFLGISAYALHIQYNQMKLKMKDMNAKLPYRMLYSVRYGPKWLTGVSATFLALALLRWNNGDVTGDDAAE